MSEYSEKLKHPKWQKKRLQILERDNYFCQSCGDDENQLHVHHIKYIFGKEIWDYKDELLITLCHNCHKSTSLLKKEIKEIIDIDFVHNEYLEELCCVLKIIKDFNPPDFMALKKQLKKIKKNG